MHMLTKNIGTHIESETGKYILIQDAKSSTVCEDFSSLGKEVFQAQNFLNF